MTPTSNPPFEPGDDTPLFGGSDVAYFATPALAQRLDLIEHLVEYGSQLLLVVGEAGIGKTRMLTEMLLRAQAHWRTCAVAANPMLDAAALLDRIVTGFSLPLPQGEGLGDRLEALETHLKAAEDAMLVPVVYVDDAHELPLDAFLLLMQLAEPQPQRARLRVVLFCEPQITAMLATPKLAPFRQGVLHAVDLPPFSPTETRDFIEWHLGQRELEDHAAAQRFTSEVVRSIHKASGGLPGRIQQVAQRVWEGSGRNTEAPGALPGPWQRLAAHPRYLVGGGIGLLALLGLLALVQNLSRDPSEPPSPAPVTLELPPPPGSDQPMAAVRTDPGTAGDVAPAVAEADLEELPLPFTDGDPPDRPPNGEVPTTAEPEAPSPADPPLEAPPPPQPPRPEAPMEPVPPPSPAPAPEPAPPPQPAPAPPRPAPTEAPSATPRDGLWLQAQNPSHYTLQLLGSHDKQAVLQFLNQHRLNDRGAWYASEHQGRPWYVAVYGIYPNRAEASAAAATLPPAVQALKPWPRSISDVRSAMERRP